MRPVLPALALLACACLGAAALPAASTTVYEMRLDDLVASMVQGAAGMGVRKVAVVDFVEASTRQRLPASDLLEEDLANRLAGDGSLQVVMRSRTKDVVHELKLGETGLADPADRKSFGKLAQADALLTGTYVALGKDLAVNATLVEVETGKALWAGHCRLALSELPPNALQPTSQYQESGQAGATLNVRTFPAGAQIFLDSKVVGLSPASIANVKPGHRKLTLILTGYEVSARELELEPAGSAAVDLDLRPLSARWTIKTQPPGARLWLDGKALGAAPRTVSLVVGRHQFRAEAEGFKPYADELEIRDKEIATKVLRLQENDSSVLVTASPAPARVFLDGREVGTADPSVSVDPVTAGIHHLKVSKPGYAAFEEDIAVHGANAAVVNVVLESGEDDWEAKFLRKKAEREDQ